VVGGVSVMLRWCHGGATVDPTPNCCRAAGIPRLRVITLPTEMRSSRPGAAQQPLGRPAACRHNGSRGWAPL